MQLQLLLVVGALGAACCSDKIIRGNDADPDKYPWQISLFLGYDYGVFCAGALVTPSFILTAAHCYYGLAYGPVDLNRTTAVAGLYNYTNIVANIKDDVQIRQPVELFYHPKSKNATYEWDFALIKVDTPFEINERVNLTILAETDGTIDLKRCYMAGFGWIAERRRTDPDVLQEYKPTVRSRAKCRAAAERENKPGAIFGTADSIKGHMMCTKNKKQGASNHDDGGALTCWDKKTDTGVTVAIHSWVLAGMKWKRGWNVYMRVQFAYDWIVETTSPEEIIGYFY